MEPIFPANLKQKERLNPQPGFWDILFNILVKDNKIFHSLNLSMILSGALIKKKFLLKSTAKKGIGQFITTDTTITDEVMKDIDRNKNGTGSMVLIRFKSNGLIIIKLHPFVLD